MASNTRIRFNPVTKDIEIEGTEKFVKTYFGKLQAMISGGVKKKAIIKKELKPAKAAPSQNKTKQVAKKKEPGEKITNTSRVVGLIQGSTEGISTAELKGKTGLTEQQIWYILNRANKKGQIRKINRGVYGPVAGQES